MAEKNLELIIDALRVVSDIQNMDETNPITHRQSNPTIRKVNTVVCAYREPYNLIVPLNFIWFCFDPKSDYYRTALRRVSKEADAQKGFVHTYEVIDTMAQYEEDQYYDDEDAALLAQNDPLPIATDDVLGIARLSVPPVSGATPVVVGDNDPRNSDPREPTEHTHPEVPATQIKTKTGVVTIGNSAAPVTGSVLIATSPTTAVWRPLTSNDIQK